MVGKTISISGFSIITTADEVKKFLEKHTGIGTVYAINVRPSTKFLEKHTGNGTVYAIKVRPSKVTKPRPSAYAVVQFTERQHAEEIKSMIERNIHYLKVRHMDRDMVPEPKVSMFDLPQTNLHLGCQVSDEKLAVLCTISDVVVNFGANMRKICFSLSWKDRSYKLELSYQSIWEIQLHRSTSLGKEFLLFLVQEAPRIYEKCVCTSAPNFKIFMDLQDDQWIRTTDFTSLSYIGQSSAFCVELPHRCNLPSIGDYFVYYREVNDRFSLLSGLPYSHGLNLVPIVQPTEVDIPYKILFKVNHMIQNGTLSGPTVDERFFRLIDPSKFPVSDIERALKELSYSKSCCFDPTKWLSDKYSKYRKSNHHTESTSITHYSGLVYVHRVQVTPSKVYFYGPDIIVSNRVLRNYSEYLEDFIRISYVDEDGGKMSPTDLLPRSASEKRTDIYKRILSTLGEGIVLGNKKFEFLAFSSSQLRENSVWMFASRNGLSAADIRKWMGDFSKIRNVAKYAARLGQSFSSSTETLRVLRHEVASIPDIENSEGYLFSDGIGKISPDFARRVAIKCKLKSTPSAFQIRYGGYKGVVAVDPTSTLKLSLRKSMSKYESENTTLDVLAYSKYQPCFLNRQLITLLSTLGVADDVFEAKQQEVVDQLDEILTDPKRAEEALTFMFPGETTNVLKEILLCGYRSDKEPFLSMSLQTFRAAKLFELRTKSRIFVPKGRSMMGCLDETRTLDYGQVFVQVSCAGSRQFGGNGLSRYGQSDSSERTVVVEGPVVVAKNPCLHPGDVRVLIAVDVPDLHHMVDCVVFPQRGKRPHPNECSGSDLDGDIYFVSWDPELIPLRLVTPMKYTAAPSEMLDHDVSIEEVQEYFTDYIVNNSLGIIANAHTVFADRERMKAERPECLELAKLFSIAVDFPKTGVPAVIPPHLQVKEYPDFMEKLDKPAYISQGVIGKLFRMVNRLDAKVNHIEAFTREVAIKTYDPDMEMPGFESYLEDAYWFKGEYDFKLGNLMDHYGIKTEAEILTGNMTKLYKFFNKYKDREVLTRVVKSLRKEVRTWFKGTSGTSNDENDLDAKASACYYVTYHWDYWGCYNEELKRPHFLSFPWCLYDRLISIKRMKMNHCQSTVERLRRRMESRLRLG